MNKDSAYEDGRPGNWTRMPQEREVDLVIISEYYLRGYSSPQIAAVIAKTRPYSLAPETIRKDLGEIRKRWLQQQLINFNEAQARELARLDAVIDEAWEAWRRSQDDQVKESIENIKDEQVGIMAGAENETEGAEGEAKTNYRYSRDRRVVNTAGRDGSNVFLQTIMSGIKMRAEILGLFAPDRLVIDWREQAAKMGVDQLARQQFEDMVNQFAEAMKENPDSE